MKDRRRVDGRVLPSRLARYLLPALFVILTAAIGGVTGRFYASQKELTQRGAQGPLLNVADAKFREISEWRKERLGEARAIMADTFAVAAFERVIEGKAAASERAAAVDYLRSICYHRITQGLTTACCENCPTGARQLVDFKDPKDPVHEFLRDNKVTVLKPYMATEAKVYYKNLDGSVR